MDVAGALQPEICLVLLERQVFVALVLVALQADWLTRSREVAKGYAQGRCSVFGGRAADGSPRVRGVVLVSREGAKESAVQRTFFSPRIDTD